MRSPSSRTYRDLSWRPCRPTLRRVPACTSWWHRTPTKEASSDTFWSLVVIIVVNCFSYYNNLHFIRRRNVVGVTAVYEFRLLRFVSHMWSAKIKQFRQLETNFAVKFRCISVMRPATTTLEHAPYRDLSVVSDCWKSGTGAWSWGGSSWMWRFFLQRWMARASLNIYYKLFKRFAFLQRTLYEASITRL